jgi:hypothetical protein
VLNLPTKPVSRSGPDMPKGWVVRDLGDALQGSGQKPPWIIEDLLLAETATQISAHPHSMKSLAWLAAAIESVATQTVWGHFDASAVSSSLFIESEDPQWLVEERIRGIAAGLGLSGVEDAPGFHYLRAGPFDLVKFESNLGEIFVRPAECFGRLCRALGNYLNLIGARGEIGWSEIWCKWLMMARI